MNWLTQEWIRDTLAAAEEEWSKSGYRSLELNYVMGHEEWMNPKVREVYVTNFIANAAVEKVVEWLKDNNQPSVELREEGGFHIEAAVRLDGFLVLPEKEWAELKQEVGL